MNVKYLIEKCEQAHCALGWRMGGSIELGYNVEEEGDLWMYVELHNKAVEGELLSCLTECRSKLREIFGDPVISIEFFEHEKSPSGYAAAIELDPEYDTSKGSKTNEV